MLKIALKLLVNIQNFIMLKFKNYWKFTNCSLTIWLTVRAVRWHSQSNVQKTKPLLFSNFCSVISQQLTSSQLHCGLIKTDCSVAVLLTQQTNTCTTYNLAGENTAHILWHILYHTVSVALLFPVNTVGRLSTYQIC